MSHIFNSAEIKASSLNAETVKKKYINSELYWSAGSTVTYVVDTGTSYTEEVDSGASCLSPTTFTPSKDGWTFVGWREDTTASGSVLSSKVMESEPITLYAVYAKTITAHFISGIGGTNTQDVQGTSYYNSAGNVSTIDITAPSGKTETGWTWRGWSKYWDQAAAASVYLKNGGTTNINHENDGITYYGLYQQTITLSYNGNGSTSGSVTAQTGTRYHNSAGNYSNPSFTLASNGFTRIDYTFNGWNLGAVGATITLSASTTAYAQWTQVSLTLFDGGTFYYDFGVLTEYEDTDGLGDGEYASYNKNNGLYMAAYAYYYRIAWVTTSKIDVTNLKTLNFNISGITSVGDATWMIGLQSTRKVTKAWDNNDAYNGGYGNTLSAGTISLDVSGLSGSYYVIIQIDSCNRKTLGFTATKGWFAV